MHRNPNTRDERFSVLFIINSLVAGGAEHVMAEVAGALASRGHHVHVMTLQHRPDFYTLDNRIVRHRLNLMRKTPILFRAFALIKRIQILRRRITEIAPDCVVSFMDRVNVFAIPASGIYPIIISERNNPMLGSSRLEIRILRRLFYRRANRIVSVSQGVSDSIHWVPERRKTVIYNPIKTDESRFPLPFTPITSRRYIVGIGRLSHQKGFHNLIEAFWSLSPDYPEWDLVIYGEGALRPELESFAERLGIRNHVFLPGLAPVFEALRASDLFVLSSLFEGFPNVLLEAMQVGVASIATDCPFGPSEIVESGLNGILVPPGDVPALAAALRDLMSSPSYRAKLAKEAKQTSNRFRLEAIVDEWEREIASVAMSRD